MKKLTILILSIFSSFVSHAQDPAPSTPHILNPSPTFYRDTDANGDTAILIKSAALWANIARRHWVYEHFILRADSTFNFVTPYSLFHGNNTYYGNATYSSGGLTAVLGANALNFNNGSNSTSLGAGNIYLSSSTGNTNLTSNFLQIGNSSWFNISVSSSAALFGGLEPIFTTGLQSELTPVANADVVPLGYLQANYTPSGSIPTYTASNGVIKTGANFTLDTISSSGAKGRTQANAQFNDLATRALNDESNIAANTTNIAAIPSTYVPITAVKTTNTNSTTDVTSTQLLTTALAAKPDTSLYSALNNKLSHLRKFNVQDYGIIDDSTLVDNSAALRTLINMVSSTGGGTIYFPHRITGKYGMGSSDTLRNNVILEGEDMHNTFLYAINTGYPLLVRFDTTRIAVHVNKGYCGLKNIGLWGYGDRGGTTNTAAASMSKLGNCQYVFYDHVYAKYAEYFSLQASAEVFYADHCLVEYGFHDGINAADSRTVIYTNNIGNHLDDDFLAAAMLSDRTDTNSVKHQVVIVGNKSFDTEGIVATGSHDCTISNNTMDLVKGRAIFIGYDNSVNYGNADVINATVSNNVITNVIDGSLVGFGAGAFGIEIKLPYYAAGGTAPGDFNYTTQSYQLPDGNWRYNTLATGVHGANTNIIISNNSLAQTAGTGTHVSDIGYGNIYTQTGFQNPAYTGTICYSNTTYPAYGIYVTGAVRGMDISHNNIYGFTNGMKFDSTKVKENLKIDYNTIQRSTNGIIFSDPAAAYHVGVTISDNIFDIDPYLQAADRSGGAWVTGTAANYCAINSVQGQGFIVTNNTFKNCKRVTFGAGTFFVQNNNYICNPSTGEGIGTLVDPLNNRLIWTDCNPTSTTFNSTLANGIYNSTVQPTTGYYRIGEIVRNTNNTNLNSSYLIGWLKLTTGNSNTTTDWSPLYIQNSGSSYKLDDINLYGVAGTSVINQKNSSNTARWQIGLYNTESGSNVGSDWYLGRYPDAGTPMTDKPISVNRSTGVVSLVDGITASGTNTLNGKINISTSANNASGFATLVAGTVTVANTSITANSIILMTRKTAGGTTGTFSYTVSAGTSFTINSSSSTDTSVVGYVIIN